jgi:hypothetical protein
MRKSALILAATLCAASSAQAQEHELSRHSFTFFDNTLSVEVVADMPGQLQVVRGEPGRIDVAGRVPGGIPAFALGGREENQLRLTAVGGNHADFVVIVPEDALVKVKLPDRNWRQVGMTQQSGQYSWRSGEQSAAPAAAPPRMRGAALPGPMIAYSDQLPPRTLNVTSLNSVRTVSVRFEGPNFHVAGNQPMKLQEGDPANVEVRTGRDVQDLVVTVPLGTSDFKLLLAGRTAMNVVGGEIRVYCEPLTEQDLGMGRRWFTFAPEMGRMTCR